MIPYAPHTDRDRQRMLDSIGVTNVDELFDDIPRSIRYEDTLPIGNSLSEHEVMQRLTQLAGRNLNAVSFLGAGSYDRIIPAAVKALSSLPSFVTAYTPYQPEISQGLLQAIFEYQTIICELTGMDVSNASLYDGHSAAAEAAAICLASKRKSSVVLASSTLHPFTLQVLDTWAKGTDFTVELIPEADGVCDLAALQTQLRPEVAGVILQNPNIYGFVENYEGLAQRLHEQNVMLVISSDPLSLALQKSQGEWGADIAIGDTQPLGLSSAFGGPSCGYLAVRKDQMRKMPGRIVGQTKDSQGRRAYVLTLQAREQHIKRERATSNICSNQALAALTTTIHVSLVGWNGMVEAARQSLDKASYLAKSLTGLSKVALAWDKPYWCEFPLRFSSAEVMEHFLAELKKEGILGGVRLGQLTKETDDAAILLVAVTEKRTKSELDRYIAVARRVLA
jgi:glycine dehydrogenase subunit 1